MQLILFDEAKNDEEYPVYHIGGVCIDETDLADVEARITKLAEQFFGKLLLGRDTEFHAAEIIHRKAHFRTWTELGARLTLLNEFVDVLSLKQVSLIDVQINSAKLHDSQSSSDIAFMFLCKRSNQLMRARGKMGMLIGDRDTDSSAAKCATSLSSYRINGTEFQYRQKITNLVDSVHFTHSRLSRFLQLADVYTWLKQFRHRNKDSEDQRHRALFDILNDMHTDIGPSKYKEWPK